MKINSNKDLIVYQSNSRAKSPNAYDTNTFERKAQEISQLKFLYKIDRSFSIPSSPETSKDISLEKKSNETHIGQFIDIWV